MRTKRSPPAGYAALFFQGPFSYLPDNGTFPPLPRKGHGGGNGVFVLLFRSCAVLVVAADEMVAKPLLHRSCISTEGRSCPR